MPVSTIPAKDNVEEAGYWGFPFQPYQIQVDFMKKLYDCIDQERIGIFESPTGTGKSLSLICGALTWLRTHSEIELKKKLDNIDNSEDPSFVKQRKRKLAEESYQAVIYENSLENQFEKLILTAQESTRSKKAVTPHNKHDIDYDPDLLDYYDDELEDVTSASFGIQNATSSFMDKELQAMLAREEEILKGPSQHTSKGKHSLPKGRGQSDNSLPQSTVKLSQTMHELRKTSHSSWVRSLAMSSRMHLCINEDVRKKTGPSLIRLNEACISCQKLLTTEEVDIQVLHETELGVTTGSQVYKCNYYKPASLKTPENVLFYEDFIRSVFSSGQRSKDIEDLHDLGKEESICPYYGVQQAATFAQFITLPYAYILHKATREALGIGLSGNIVIFDEAHNLVDAIRSLYEIEIDWELLHDLKLDLQAYLKRYETRLKGKNIYFLNILIDTIEEVQQTLTNIFQKSPTGGIISVHSFLQNGFRQPQESKLNSCLESSTAQSKPKNNISNSKSSLLQSFNFLRLKTFLQVSQLSRKILGCTARRKKELALQKNKDEDDNANIKKRKPGRSTNNTEEVSLETIEFIRNNEEEKLLRPLDAFVEFLCRISGTQRNETNNIATDKAEDISASPDEGGKLLYYRKESKNKSNIQSDSERNSELVPNSKCPQEEFCLKYLVLHVAPYFQEVSQAARCVILAGGTLQPIEDLLLQLLSTSAENTTEPKIKTEIKPQINSVALSNIEMQNIQQSLGKSPVEDLAQISSIPVVVADESRTVSSIQSTNSAATTTICIPSPKIPIHFSCGHVIPPGNFLILNLPFGNRFNALSSNQMPSSNDKKPSQISTLGNVQFATSDMVSSRVPFRFTFENRNNPILLSSFSHCLLNFIRIIPQGVILFFPSHQALQIMLDFWQNYGESGPLSGVSSQHYTGQPADLHSLPYRNVSGKSFYDLINEKKRIFYERQKSVSQLLSSYNAYCDNVPLSCSDPLVAASLDSNLSSPTCTGAVLMAVMGGRLSEGINFSDGRGRAIFLVGLPYPNPNDVLLKEQKKYYDYSWYKRNPPGQPQSTPNSLSATNSQSPNPKNAPQYLENLCMNLVNQTIGRVLRHASDYAVVFLCDIRFDDLHHQLPTWMVPYYKNYFVEPSSSQNPYGKCIREVVLFFKQKKL